MADRDAKFIMECGCDVRDCGSDHHVPKCAASKRIPKLEQETKVDEDELKRLREKLKGVTV